MPTSIDTAIDQIYECALAPSCWPIALQKVADCFGDVGCILLYNRDDGSFGVVQSHSLDRLIPEYAQNWSMRDIRALRTRERGYFFERDVITDRDVVTESEIQSDPFYAEFLKKFGLKYFAASMVSPDSRTEVALSVQRAINKLPFTDEELAQLSILGKHVERALRLGIRLIDEETTNAALSDALSRLDIGVFILDSLGRVLHSNSFAQNLIGDGIDIVRDRLRFVTATEASEGKSGFLRGSSLSYDRPVQIIRRNSSRPLTAYLLPVPTAASAGHDFLSQARALVLLIDPVSGPPDAALVRDLLGLTLAESRIASLVGSGVSPSDVANKLGIAESTVRKSLNSVFAKTGVSRQSELAALMTKLTLRKPD